MSRTLISNQALIDSFITMLPPTNNSTSHATQDIQKKIMGAIEDSQLPQNIQIKLIHLLSATTVVDQKFKALFHGDISQQNNDHSAADFALVGYFKRQNLTLSEADLAFRASKLYRQKWDDFRGDQTYGERTLREIYSQAELGIKENILPYAKKDTSAFSFQNPNEYRPIFVPMGMPAREFIGPRICDGIRLFPAKALSSLVALGAVGKTSVLMTIAAHIAAGKGWNGHPLKQQKVAMFFCEETQEEISRKFSAITEKWPEQERMVAINNLLTVPLLGIDARITTINKSEYHGSEITDKMIELLKDFRLSDGLVILDHMQGFTAGDLNLTETATAACREANKIAREVNSAVVIAAHIGKKDIKATEVEQGFAVGSLAFENATRQMSGMIPMSEENAKKYGLQDTKNEYVWLGLAKNSYGASTGGLWLKKIVNQNYHTVVFEPTLLSLPSSSSKLTANQKLEAQIVAVITKHLFTTKNILDGHSGKDGIFKVSKAKVRDATKSLIDVGVITEHTVTQSEREEHNLAKQVKVVLRANNFKSATTETANGNL